KNTDLTYLRLDNNNLSEIDVTKNTNLTNLNLDHNNLSEIDVTKNTDLTDLRLGNNNLSEIDVTKNTSLTVLILSNNNLSEIDVTKNTSLAALSLDNNNLSEIDVTKNIGLTDLHLRNNNLSEIDVTKNTSLVRLGLAGNSIFDFSSAENLTLDQDSFLGNQSQTIETESTTYVLPPLFTQVKTEGWGAGFADPMYTDQPFILTNATLSADGKSITIINSDEPATIEIDGGMADGSILTINYTEPQERTYTLSFDANGGANAPAALTYGPTANTSHTFTIPTDEPTYSGYVFLGWADTANATTANQDYASGRTITINANKTLYAVWQVEEPEPEPGSEPESEPESTAQAPDTGLITGDGQNGVNDYNTATFIPLLVIMLTSIHIILKIRAKILSKIH
ncbi:InlB B-repeat-containing protein, partial [Candidatus Saccharibacteria bacterium]|nr:InlB B-repeat-containing protein [Candidatus Saccharibacteria bacterium]